MRALKMLKKIYSLGYSNLSAELFISTLKRYKIGVVIDVRRFPRSKVMHFMKDELIKMLKKEGIGYVHLEALGGYRKSSGEKWKGYKNHMQTEKWLCALEKLEQIALSRPAVFICLERNYKYCHRQFIAEKLQSRGWIVVHLKP